MPFVDSHVHLDRYPKADATAMLGRAAAAGVERLLGVGVDLESSRRTSALAAAHPALLAAAGVHPARLHTTTPGAALAALEEMLRESPAAAIGEVGLEFREGLAPPAQQREFLAGCLDLARRLDLATCLHVAGPDADALVLLREAGPVRAVVHYFQGSRELAERYLELGCWISVGKPVTRPENEELRAAVQGLPLDRILVETDTYPLPGRTTEPRNVIDVYRAVAALQGRDLDDVAAVVGANFRRFLGRGWGPPAAP